MPYVVNFSTILTTKLLRKEGVNELNSSELVEATIERGLEIETLSTEDLRDQLNEWLKLSTPHPHEAERVLMCYHGYKFLPFRLLSE